MPFKSPMTGLCPSKNFTGITCFYYFVDAALDFKIAFCFIIELLTKKSKDTWFWKISLNWIKTSTSNEYT